MTRDPCCLCGGTGHHPGDCPLRKGMAADPPPDDEPTRPPVAPDPEGDYFCCLTAAMRDVRWVLPLRYAP